MRSNSFLLTQQEEERYQYNSYDYGTKISYIQRAKTVFSFRKKNNIFALEIPNFHYSFFGINIDETVKEVLEDVFGWKIVDKKRDEVSKLGMDDALVISQGRLLRKGNKDFVDVTDYELQATSQNFYNSFNMLSI